MKTRSIQTLLLAATLGLLVTACNNDSDQTVDITKPINVKLSLTTTGTNIPISRAAIGATEFDDDDALGLYIAHKTGANGESPITSSLDPKNAPWVNGSFTDEPLYWQNVTDQHTLYAYYCFGILNMIQIFDPDDSPFDSYFVLGKINIFPAKPA